MSPLRLLPDPEPDRNPDPDPVSGRGQLELALPVIPAPVPPETDPSCVNESMYGPEPGADIVAMSEKLELLFDGLTGQERLDMAASLWFDRDGNVHRRSLRLL